MNEIIYGDCINLLPCMEKDKFSLILTDPPYNCADASKVTKRKGVIQSTKDCWGAWDTFSREDYYFMINQFLKGSYRLLCPGGAMYIFFDIKEAGVLARTAINLGFTYQNMIAIVKTNPLPHFRKNGWRSGFELCVYLTKGKPRIFNFLSQQICINVQKYRNTARTTEHPTEKPLDVCKLIIQASSAPGDWVLDPFAGSGTTLIAATELDRHCVCIENDRSFLIMMVERYNQYERSRNISQ